MCLPFSRALRVKQCYHPHCSPVSLLLASFYILRAILTKSKVIVEIVLPLYVCVVALGLQMLSEGLATIEIGVVG
jgi:hypothetical protein